MKKWPLIFILLIYSPIHAQNRTIDRYLYELGTDDEQQSFRLNNFYTTFRKLDATTQKNLLQVMEKRVKREKSDFLKARFSFFKSFVMRFFVDGPKSQIIGAGFEEAITKAKALDNDMLLADGCYWYAIYLLEHVQVAESLFYHLKSIEAVEKVGPEKFYGLSNRYNLLGELLYHTREYTASVRYSKKALETKDQVPGNSPRITTLNTIGLAYQKLKQSDSAIVYFDKAAALAARQGIPIWVTIPNANKAQIWFSQKKYAAAFPLFEADHKASMKGEDYPNAANNLQWMAKVYMVQNKTDSALARSKQALELVRNITPKTGVHRNIYQTLAAVYEQLNKPDSSEHYFALYTALHDSTEAVVATSRSEIVQLRLNDERNRSKIESLQKEQLTDRINLNLFIGFFLLLSVTTIVLYHRQRLKQQQRQQLNAAELKAANEQMLVFTNTIADNLERIDTLQRQIDQHSLDPTVKLNLEALKQKTILTEEDWEVFQDTFQRIYPGFFDRLRKMNPAISPAESRFAAIIRLHMSNNQAGAMLGISPDSARKTRLRLRQRLHLSPEANIEQVIQTL